MNIPLGRYQAQYPLAVPEETLGILPVDDDARIKTSASALDVRVAVVGEVAELVSLVVEVLVAGVELHLVGQLIRTVKAGEGVGCDGIAAP